MILGGVVSATRGKIFGKQFKEKPAVKQLQEEHKKAFPLQKFCPDGMLPVRLRLFLPASAMTRFIPQAILTWAAASLANC
jgi:hypothetical protein